MLFGEKFYPLLNKMPAWRHSLFALVLATRQYPNFALWCEVKEVQGKTQYLNALKACWHFHYDKFNHVDLSAAFDEIAPFLPMELEEYSEGDSFAFDAAVMLDAALSSVPDNTKGALNASQASLASVIRYCEHAFPDNCATEEDLLDLTPIQAEMSFQIDLMEQVRQPRSPENVIELCRLALESGCSNIGLESELTFADFAECFVSSAHAPHNDQDSESEALSDENLPELEPDELEGLTPATRPSTAQSPDYDEAADPWDEQDLIVFSPDCPEGFTPPKDLHAQLAAAHAPSATANEPADLKTSDAQTALGAATTAVAPAEDDADFEPDVTEDITEETAEDAAAYEADTVAAPQSVPSYAEMKAREAALATSAQANADQDLELAVNNPDASAAAFEVAPEDLERTDHNLRQALAEQKTAAALLEQLAANNERLGAEEELIMAQAQAMAQDEARARSEHVFNSPQAPEVGPQVPAANPDDADGEVDVDLEFERIAQTAALLEQQLEQELLLETGQNLDSIIASGADPATLRRRTDESAQERTSKQPGAKAQREGGKGHKESKHHKGHHDHHKDKGPKEGKGPKFKAGDKEHGPKGKFKGDKPFKADKDSKSDKWGKPFKGDKHHAKGDKPWHSEQEGKAFKDKDGKPGKSGKWSKSEKPFKDGKAFKEGKAFKGDKQGKKHGGKGHNGAGPKVFGAHAPKGKTV